ncbi:ferritin-like superfamily [Cladochytrium replicatum]|nr:ferritin-like superfamily [Cladochytrium replicatum]
MSVARQNFGSSVEAAINSQLNLHFRTSHLFLGFAAYFDQDGVALPGFARFYKKLSQNERETAFKLIDYQNKRGGKVVLSEVPAPPVQISESVSPAFASLELALQISKDVNGSLLKLQSLAAEENDPATTDFVEGEFLQKQVDLINLYTTTLTQARRAGDGLGLYLFDRNVSDSV